MDKNSLVSFLIGFQRPNKTTKLTFLIYYIHKEGILTSLINLLYSGEATLLFDMSGLTLKLLRKCEFIGCYS